MIRSGPVAVAFAALAALAALSAVILAACGAPGPSEIADPSEILRQAVAATRAATSVHYVADVSGSVALDPTGSGSPIPFDLKGTKAEGDVDLAAGNATGALTFPGLGPAADAIVIGKDAYLRVGLLGQTWQKSSAAESPLGVLSDPKATVAGLTAALAQLPTPPTKNPDAACGDATCYVVTVDVPNAGVAGAIGGAVGGALGGALGGLPGGAPGGGGPGGLALPSSLPSAAGQGTVEIWARRDDLRPVRIVITADGGPSGRLVVDVAFSSWDAPVSISAPPADQVQAAQPGASGVPGLPSFSLPPGLLPSPSSP